ncbi:MAG TPA: cation diffusion facilitator family transporter [Longimicrobiales bacterium]
MNGREACGCPMGPGHPGDGRRSDGGAPGAGTGAHGHADHDHAHAHGPAHAHALDLRRGAGKKRLKLVLALTGTFMVVEFAGGWLANSLALMADAGHMLTDVASIALSLFAIWFAQRPATPEKTYGYLRWEILAALLNGAALIVLSLFIFYEAFRRFREPVEVEGGLMLAVAVGGLLVNVAAALSLHRHAEHSLNVRGAYLHVLGDLLGSVGAIVAALVILATGWTVADPLISLAVGGLILFSSWKLVRESVDVLLEAVPPHIDLSEVREAIDAIPGVDDVHDLHVWTVTSGYFAMSGHAVVDDPAEHQRVLQEIHDRLADRFGIRHITVQLERESIYRREADHL